MEWRVPLVAPTPLKVVRGESEHTDTNPDIASVKKQGRAYWGGPCSLTSETVARQKGSCPR